MPDKPDLAGLEAERARLYADLSGVGDFRRGTLSTVFRKCGKPNWRRAAERAGSRAGVQADQVAGRQDGDGARAAGSELDKAQRDTAEWQRF
jgi:hypothetical protein